MSRNQTLNACDLSDLLSDLSVIDLDDDAEPKFIKISSCVAVENGPVATESTEHYDNKHGNVKITIDPLRPKKFFIAIKLILKDMNISMNRYTHIIHWEKMQYVLWQIFEKQLAEVLEGVEDRLKARDVYALYRKSYPQDNDDDFIDEVFHDIWEGKYNDPEEEISEDVAQETEYKEQKDENPENVFNISEDANDECYMNNSGVTQYQNEAAASKTPVYGEAYEMDTNP